MKYVNNNGSVNLNNVNVVGGLGTLGVGKYTGIFAGVTADESDKQWVTLTTTKASHVEQSDLDVSELKLGQRIKFEIAVRDGAVALMNGTRYKLKGADGVDLTEWTTLPDLYDVIRDTNVVLAEPKIKSIEKLEAK